MSHAAPFLAEHLSRSASFCLPLPAERALSLFTPEGERSWVPGWEPECLHPASASSAPGTVFRTTHGGEETLWLVLTFDEVRARAEYARLTPGSRMGTVEVRVEPAGAGACVVTVRYELTALGEEGNRVLREMHPAAFEAMIAGWERLILERLAHPGR